jgi:hypothetical protein
VFNRISKAKEGGYFEANKQFLCPLPIPRTNDVEKTQVAEKAKLLQELHTRRRDLLLAIDKRLDSAQCEDDKRDEGWFWADVKSLEKVKKEAPPELKGRESIAWANARREARLADRLNAINTMLRPGVRLTVRNDSGELKLLATGVPLIEGIFLDETEAACITMQWRQKIRQTNVTEKFDAKRLMNQLLKLRKTANDAIKIQIVKLDADIQSLDTEIAQAETDMNRLTYSLYGLTEEDVKLVEGGEAA